MNKKLIVAGEGGQGVQIIGKLLVKIGFELGSRVSYLPNFGVEQRGGVSLAFVQISDQAIAFPKFETASMVVILAPRAIERVARYITKETVIIFDNCLVKEELLAAFKNEKIAIPASFYAKKKLVPKSFNMIILGAILTELDLMKHKIAKKALSDHFALKYKKEPQFKHFNQRGLEVGAEMAEDLIKEQKWREKILKK